MMNVHEILRVNYDRINNSRFCEYNEQRRECGPGVEQGDANVRSAD